MEYWFYHIEQGSIKRALPILLEKTLARNWRAYVKIEVDQMQEFDTLLWCYRDDSFLPHGRSDEPMAEQQPVCLGSEETLPVANIDVVFIVDGTPMDIYPDVKRYVFFIDGKIPDKVKIARQYWQSLKAQDIDVSYWQQDSQGRWAKKS